MNKKLMAGLARDAIFFVAGTGVGVLVGKKVLENKFETQMQDEIKNLREMNKRRMDRVEDELRKKYDLAKATTPDTVIVNVEEAPEPEPEPEQPKQRVNYAQPAKKDIIVVGDETPTPSNVEKGEYRQSELEQIAVDVPEDPPPYLVTVTQFMDGEWEHHEKKDLDYFVNEDILIDDGTWVVDRDGMFPPEALTSFGFGSNDEDIVYVRNEQYMTDYVIHRHTEPFDTDQM